MLWCVGGGIRGKAYGGRRQREEVRDYMFMWCGSQALFVLVSVARS